MVRCHLCKTSHQLKYCSFFVMLSPELRRRTVERHEMCVNCLAHTHTVSECHCLERCRYCGDKHHSMLHVNPQEVPNAMVKAPTEVVEHPTTSESRQPPIYVTPMIRANVRYDDDENVLTLMVNPQARHSWILWKSALKFPTFRAKHNPGGDPYGRFIVESHGPTYAFTLGLTHNLGIEIPEPIGDTRLRAHFNHLLPLAHENFHNEDQVDIVISGKSWKAIQKAQVIKTHENVPVAQATTFGWVIHGIWGGCSCPRHEATPPIRLPK